jgi:3-oxoacyl-(acyl-carrier-protein) synthase
VRFLGTGTQAGDPREAFAIGTTFFPPEEDHSHRPKLVVGSIKTVIGHTEGCKYCHTIFQDLERLTTCYTQVLVLQEF